MYIYNKCDQKIIDERVAQFRDQTQRYLNGQLSEQEFLPLRLQNGLYIQRHAPMLRVAIPYGLLNSTQLRMLGTIAQKYDKNYGHFSTRQNIQFNWPKLEQVPNILADLATVQMHAIQTSGNCIRNVTTDEFAGVTPDEIEDPRPYCEIIRQWSTFHPEFAYLPRKFKIAVNGHASTDRAAVKVHDIGLNLVRNEQGEVGFEVLVGGGLGRTPLIGQTVRVFLPKSDLLSYLEAILRVYNRYGRRDNKYKARIKILVKAMGIEAFREKVEQQWRDFKNSNKRLTPETIEHMQAFFNTTQYENIDDTKQQAEDKALATQKENHAGFTHWLKTNTHPHKTPGYHCVILSLKMTGHAPGDISGDHMLAVADLADQYSLGEIRVSHRQNLVLAHVRTLHLFEVWEKLKALGFATANIGRLTDMICCPGGDFCALANAKSIPVAEDIQRHFDKLDYLHDLGPIDLNISGCMNACGHHHVGNIGILGVDKKGREYYQILLAGSSYQDANIGKILGPSFERNEVVDVIDKIIKLYVQLRVADESFAEVLLRIGIEPFREAIYKSNDEK